MNGFKTLSKQLFGLGKEQANDFDAQIAAVTLVMIQYILISVKYRFDNYESKGTLFRQAKTEIFRNRLSDRLWGLLLAVLQIITELFEGADEDDLIEKVLNNEKTYLRIENIMKFTP